MAEKIKIVSVPDIVGFISQLSAVILAGFICLFSNKPVPITNPEILAAGAFFILMPFKPNPPLETLQKLTGLYLIAVLVNETSSQYFEVSLLSTGFSVSYSVIILSLCATGFFISRNKLADWSGIASREGFLTGWLPVFVVLIVHMILLTVMLKAFYGFGYEHNLVVTGKVFLYLFLFILLWERLASSHFREILGTILLVFYFAIIVTTRLL